MFKKSITSLALVATLATSAALAVPTSQAYAKNGEKAAVAAGAAAAIALGVIAANAHKNSDRKHSFRHHSYRSNHNYRPKHHYRPHRPIPHYQAGLTAWSPAWYRHCSAQYRSFNPQTGYYKGYDGRFHFCS